MNRFLLASLPLFVACGTQGGEPRDEGDSCLEIELLSIEVQEHPLFNDRADGRAFFRVTNRSDRPVGIYGTLGEEPVPRIAVQDGRRWIEDEPIWLSCGTGLDRGELAPGASVDVDVGIPATGLSYRVGFGHWDRVGGEPPPWKAWSWTWTPAFRVPGSP